MKSVMIVAASIEEFLAEGKVLTAASLKNAYDLFGEEECAEYMMNSHIGFSANAEDVVEIHLYDFSPDETIEQLLTGYPIANVEGSNLELQSSYGGPRENTVLVTKATISLY